MEKYELTFPQRNIWLVENFYDSKMINIISGSLVIKKNFDVSLAEQTINKFVEANEAMRLRITVENSVPKQYVVPFVPFEADKVDARGKTEQEIDNIKQEYISSPIDTIDSPLFSYLLIDRGEGVGEIFLKSHHLICDGWSGSKMVTGLAQIYDAMLEGVTDFDMYPSYVEYIAKENEYKASEKFKDDEAFWVNYLEGFNEAVGIKNSYIADTKAKRYSVKLDGSLNQLILDYCKENKFSPYTIFMTALAIYLERTTEKQDIVIGTPILNRGNFVEKKMQGMFVSTMPVRFKIDEQMTFKDICSLNAKETMTLFRHQRFPISKTIDNLKKNNGLEESPYKVMVSYQNARATFEKEDTYRMSWNFSGHIQDELEIHIVDLNDDGILEVDYDYITSLFEDKEIEYIAKRIEAIIKDGIVNDKKIEQIDIMPEEEKELILNNITKVKYPIATVINLFEEKVKSKPNAIALVCEDKEITYNELNKLSNSIANYLLDNNIGQGDVVALMQNRGINMIATIFGIMKTGAAYLPIDTEFPTERVKFIVDDCQAKCIIKEASLSIENDTNIIDVENITHLSDKPVNESKAEGTAYIIYTSGTTGNPKGVLISHKSLTNLLYAMDDVKHLSECKVALSQAKYTFDMFVIETILPIVLGLKMVIATEEETLAPNKLLSIIGKNKAEVLFITPTKLNMLLNIEQSDYALANLKKLTVAGEVFPVNLLNRIRKITNTDIFNGYGPTEATVCTTIHKVDETNNITIGKCINNVYAYICDSKGRLMPLSVSGELYIGGAGLFEGYINNEQETAKKTRIFGDKKLYKSGDKCLLNLNLDFEYVGRLDSQVKLNGLRIELEEIEKNINNQENVKSSAVCIYNNILVAFVVTENSVDEVKDKLAKKLPDYMVPKYIQKVSSLPLTATGKVDKKALVKDFKIVENKNEDIVYNKLQSEIFDLIKTIVNIQTKVSVDENLIKYGLDSLSIIELALKINNKYETNISPKQIFSKLTIRYIEECISSKEQAKDTINSIDVSTELIPISDIQKELFVAYKMDTESTLYNMPGEVVLKNIDKFKLRDSVVSCLNKNIVFKTNVFINETTPYLKVIEKNIDVTLETTTKEEYDKVKNTFVQPFDLLNDTLVRCRIYDVEGVAHLLFDSHHIIMDGISMGNLIRQIEKEYNGEEFNYTYSFLDYLQNDEKHNLDEAKNYFMNMLAGKEISTSIDTDFKREAKRNFEGLRENIKLDTELVNNIKECSENLETTENSIFLAALKILLSKYTYSQDVVVGIAVSGRRQMEHLPVVGMFVNTVPMAEHISPEIKVSEYIKTTQNAIFDSIEYGTYSLEKLTNELEIKKDGSRNPIFDIVYTYQGFDTSKTTFNNENINVNSLVKDISKFDITFEIVPNKEGYQLSIEYCKKLYKESTIKSLLQNYVRCIEALLANLNNNVSDISIVNYRNKSNSTVAMPNIITVFEDVVNKYPNNIAIVHNEQSLTYAELDIKSTAIAKHLASKNISKGDVVAIMMDKSIDLLISILGILKCGAAYLPVDYELSDERIKFMLDDSNVAGVVTKHKIMNHKPELTELDKYNYIFFEDMENKIDGFVQELTDVDISSEDISYVMYTSGSTGKPKGVMNTHQGVVRLVKDTNYIEVQPCDRVALSGTIVFDASVFETWAALLNGATLDIIDKEELLDIVKFENHIIQNNVNIMLLTSALFTKFGLNKPEIFKNVKYLITGGDVLSCKAAANVINVCPNTKVINAYGPTENSVIATTYLYDNSSVTTAPIGKAINNTDCYILDRYCKPVPTGAIGELYLGGIGVAKGYINNEILTKERFVTLPFTQDVLYKTGDIVKFDEDYNIIFKGRLDNQVKIRGFRVEIEEIVAAINSIYGVKSSYVTIKNFNDNKHIYAYIAVEDTKLYNEKYIRNNLRDKIPYYMQPKFIVLLETLPYTINGKVDKAALMLLSPEIGNSMEKPRNDLENKVYKIWCKLLGREDFGIDDNFFEMGGDSLLATEFVIQCTNQNLNYSYADIYNHPTIKQLCEDNSFDLDKIYSLKSYDMLELNEEAKQINKINYDNRKDILITGATGFLGSHILANLLDNLVQGQKIYCIIREKLDVSPLARLKSRMQFFFDNKYDKLIDDNVIVLEGDIAKKNIIYDKVKEEEVVKNVGKIIHTAAYVKHFDDKDMFEKLNVNGTKNVATFCFNNNMRLFNVSTLSVCGNMLEGGQVEQEIEETTKFYETSLYIGQKLYNAYVYSKFLAELEILKLCKKGLVATNIRTGNLTGRYSDGKFQPNVEGNAFANRIKAFLSLAVIPKSFRDMYLEFTPIDYAADAIVKLAQDDTKQPRTIHLFNHNHLMVDKFIEYMKVLNIKLDMIEDSKFKAILKDNIVSHNDNMSGIIIDLNNNNEIKYTSNIIVDSKATIDYLSTYGFKWPKIDKTYVIKYIEYLKEIGFI